MNKFVIYLLLGSALTLSAQEQVQDSVAEVFAEAEVVDTVAVKPLGDTYKERTFGSFKEKYTDPEFSYETQTGAKTAWDRFWEAVRRFLDSIFSFGNAKSTVTVFDIIMKVIALIVILGVVYLIVRIILRKEGAWIFGRSRKNIAVHEVSEENIHEMDFRQLTEETKRSGNYKLAVRYYYLWLLKKLSANEMIDWHWDKTNSDYLYEIKNAALRKDFEYLSYVYDYSWYGDFPLDEKAFSKAERAFLNTLNTL